MKYSADNQNYRKLCVVFPVPVKSIHPLPQIVWGRGNFFNPFVKFTNIGE